MSAPWSFGPGRDPVAASTERRVGNHSSLRRLLGCTVALLALLGLATGCGGGVDARPAAKTAPRLVEYSSPALTFTHPATWKAYPFSGAGELHFHPLVYLSTQRLEDPCSTHGNATSCGFPVQRLAPGGVLAFWQPGESPVAGPVQLAGTPIRVGGQPAARQESAHGMCHSIGADRTIQVVSEVRRQGLMLFTACLRGPGLAQAEKQVDALLASTQFHSG